MAKTVAEIQEEAKKKIQDQKNQQNQKQDQQKQPDQNQVSELQGQVAFLKAQIQNLQEQSSRSLISEEEKKLEREAEAMRKQEEALRQEADIARILDEALKTESQARGDQGEAMSQKELALTIADTVGKALDASSKLTMGAMDKKLADSNKRLEAMQHVLVELLSGMSVNQARSQYPDFDKYAEEASKIHQANPTLRPEQAYLLAKAQAESAQPDKNKIETEKPSEPAPWTPDRPFSTSRDSSLSEESNQTGASGKRLFRQQLASAVDDYLARRMK